MGQHYEQHEAEETDMLMYLIRAWETGSRLTVPMLAVNLQFKPLSGKNIQGRGS